MDTRKTNKAATGFESFVDHLKKRMTFFGYKNVLHDFLSLLQDRKYSEACVAKSHHIYHSVRHDFDVYR